MPKLEPILRADINPLNPVPELCGVIDGVVAFHPPHLEPEILRGLRRAIDERLEKIEKEAKLCDKPIREPGRNKDNQGHV